MITDKRLTLEEPLNLTLDITDLLLLNINYKEEEINDNILRDVSYLIKKKESIFNKVIKNNCSGEEDEIFEFDKSEKYKELILDRNESTGEAEEENSWW
jgi:hypothetical protein